jgi:hypothetical protein
MVKSMAVLPFHGKKVFFVKYARSRVILPMSFGGDDDETPNDHKGVYGVDTNLYLDTGATNQVIVQLNELQVHDNYHGRHQVHNAS